MPGFPAIVRDITMDDRIWRVRCSQGPVIAVANHNGHELRSEVAALSALDKASRLREEDPFTGEWAEVVPTSLVARRSRFEVDLNRPRVGLAKQIELAGL